MLNVKILSWTFGMFGAVTFVLCVLYGVVVPTPLRMGTFLQLVLPAFTWLTFWGFWLGLAESFLYGAYVGLVFAPLYNFFSRRWGTPAPLP